MKNVGIMNGIVIDMVMIGYDDGTIVDNGMVGDYIWLIRMVENGM